MAKFMKTIVLAAVLSVTLSSHAMNATSMSTAPLAELETKIPGFTNATSANYRCSESALQYALETLELVYFNPFVPHCNALQLSAAANAMGANFLGAVAFTQLAMATGCFNPAAFATQYFVAYQECAARANQ